MKKSLLSIIALLSGAMVANADVYVSVNGAGNGDGTSWENARKGSDLSEILTDHATINGTLYIAGGEYVLVDPSHGRVTISGEGSFTVQGAKEGTPTVIRMNKEYGQWFQPWSMFKIQDTHVTFNDITFHGTNTDGYDLAAAKLIEAIGADLTFNNCEIRNFFDKNSKGVVAAINDVKSFFRFNHCYFHHNVCVQGVISCTGNADHTAYLNDVRFCYNSPFDGGDWGNEIDWSKKIYIANSSFWGNSAHTWSKATPMINATGTPVIINSSFYNCNNQASSGTIRTQRGLAMNNIILTSCNKKSFEVADNSKELKALYNIYRGDENFVDYGNNQREDGKFIMAPVDGVLDVKSSLSINNRPSLDEIRINVGNEEGGEDFLKWLGDEFGKDALGNTRDANAVTPGALQAITGNILTPNVAIYVTPEQRGSGDGSSMANAIGVAELYARLHETNMSLGGRTFKLGDGTFDLPYRIYVHADGDFAIEGGYGEDGSLSEGAVSVIRCNYFYNGNCEMISLEKAGQDTDPVIKLSNLTFDGNRSKAIKISTTCLNINSGAPVIENCRFTGWSNQEGTAAIQSGPNLMLRNVTVDNCYGQKAIRTQWGGTYYMFADGVTVTDCRFGSTNWDSALSLNGQGYINNALIVNNTYEGSGNSRGYAINSDNNLFVANSTLECYADDIDSRVIRAAGDNHTGKIINSVYVHTCMPFGDNCSSDGYNASSFTGDGAHTTDVDLPDDCFMAESYRPAKNLNTTKATAALISASAANVGDKGNEFIAWLGDGINKDIEGNTRAVAGFHPGAYEFSVSTGIEDIFMQDATPVEYYDLNGIRLSHPVKGFNIVKMSDGSVRKMIINQ